MVNLFKGEMIEIQINLLLLNIIIAWDTEQCVGFKIIYYFA